MPRHFMARAVVTTAVLALGGLVLLELTFNGRQAQPRPAVVSIEEALVQLRTQAARQPLGAPAQPASLATLDAAKEDYGRSAQLLDAAWTALPPTASDQLTRPQRVWIWRRNAACEAGAVGGVDPSQTETRRLKCKADANRERAAWLKQYSPAAPLSEASSSQPASLVPVMSPGRACAWLHARLWRLGQTLSFQGEYQNDHNGLALVRPIGCDQAIVLHEMDPAARTMLDQADPPPWTSRPRRLVAMFTARLVDAGVLTPRDDAIRLHVTDITNVRVVSGR
jgi:uncharacterized protein YecT (DUF1311 family)